MALLSTPQVAVSQCKPQFFHNSQHANYSALNTASHSPGEKKRENEEWMGDIVKTGYEKVMARRTIPLHTMSPPV